MADRGAHEYRLVTARDRLPDNPDYESPLVSTGISGRGIFVCPPRSGGSLRSRISFLFARSGSVDRRLRWARRAVRFRRLFDGHPMRRVRSLSGAAAREPHSPRQKDPSLIRCIADATRPPPPPPHLVSRGLRVRTRTAGASFGQSVAGPSIICAERARSLRVTSLSPPGRPERGTAGSS